MPADDARASAVPSTSARPSGKERDRPRLGEILVAGGAITAAQLEHALAEQPNVQLPLGQTLLKLAVLATLAAKRGRR